MKKLIVLQKDFATNEYNSVAPWVQQVPFTAPFQRNERFTITYAAYAEWCGDNSTRNVKINGTTTSLPSNWAGTLNLTIAVTLPTPWQDEGFTLGYVRIFVAQSANDRIMLEGEIININNTTATIIINNIISSSGNPLIENEEDSICFLQPIDPTHQPAAMIVRDGEESAFFSSLNPNASAFQQNADRALAVGVSTTGPSFYPTLPYWAQQWGFSDWGAIDIWDAGFHPGHFWAIQDDYDLDAQVPQNDYFTHTLHLLFGVRPDWFVSYPLRTCHVNCREDGQPTGGQVVLSGTNGNWTVNITPPTGATLVASWIALTNAEAAHQGASLDNVALMQQTQHYNTLAYTDSTTFQIVPPAPEAVAVAVFDFGAPIGYGVRVSNRISILPPPSPMIKLDIGTLDNITQNRWWYRDPYPWDAIGARVIADPSLLPTGAQHPFIRGRWWAFVKHVSGQTWMLEDAEYEYPLAMPSSPHTADVTKLFQFSRWPLDSSNPQTPTEQDVRLYLPPPPNIQLNEHYLRTYAAVYPGQSIQGTLTLAPTGPLPVGWQIIFGCLIETPTGLHYGEHDLLFFIHPWTTQGTWSTWNWQSPPLPAVPAGQTRHYEWRVALFKDQFSKTPIWQEDFQHPGANPVTPPQAGPIPAGQVVMFNFNAPADPGKYYLFVRLLVYNQDSSGNFVPGSALDFAEYAERTVKRALLPDTGRDLCAPCLPATADETVRLLYLSDPGISGIQPAGDAYLYVGPPLCEMPAPHCGYTIVSEVPPQYVDVEAIFDNYIGDTWVQAVGVTFRFPGTFRRLDDKVEEETYVTPGLKQPPIIRSHVRMYELELFISTGCQLYQVDILKYCKKITQVTTRGDHFLPFKRDLLVEDFRIRDTRSAFVVTIRLREEEWRVEYRYK